MTEHNVMSVGERYRLEGLAGTVLRRSDVDFTGERQNEIGEIVRESAVDAAIRLADHISSTNPEGLALLRQAGIEV
jgi:hypothetical protein